MDYRVISFHYTLTDEAGKVLDSSRSAEPFAFMTGSRQIIPGLEDQISSLEKGSRKNITVLAADAYGERDEELIIREPRDKFGEAGVRVGDRFRAGQEEEARIFTVVDVSETEVTLDGNHPLAGKNLFFDVEITDVRDATSEEIQHGHAHGEGGHAH
ncbi:MAG TPA: peptidylprolyl isomerase [Verrucomicrobiae bacterium]|jgi:FKBP-type peptidyl-prolyl cis-trans isomerase SlyD|nr:peptidylprolyl isomerase [Verrucomicrobiae bacterium]